MPVQIHYTRSMFRRVTALAIILTLPLVLVACGGASESDSFTAISSGHEHSCALRADGTVTCWGRQSSPPEDEKFIEISSGPNFTCALREDGSPTCWKLPENDPNADYREGLVGTTPADEKFIVISSGNSHACGLRDDGTPVCWGANWANQVSVPSNEKFVDITSSFDYTCGIREDNVALCWGNVVRQPIMHLPERLVSISGGFSEACGLTVDSTVLCWNKHSGKVYQPLPGWKLSYLGNHVSHGAAHYRCGIGFDSSVICWASDGLGGDIKIVPIPPDDKFIDVGTGLLHACGILEGGSISCWGDNRQNQSEPPTLTPPTSLPTISEICASGLVVQKGSGCLAEEPLVDTYRFVVAPSGRADVYSSKDELVESQYGWVDLSYSIFGEQQTYVVLRAHTNSDGNWTIEAASGWE